jgi:serine phosphatase RsbU (regulator of sigma subunit)
MGGVETARRELRGVSGTEKQVPGGSQSVAPEGRRAKHVASHRLPIVVLLVGGLVTALLVWASSSANAGNDHRLLKLQVRQAASILSAVLPSVETPLTAAFDVTMATHNADEFRQLLEPEVGRGGLFVSASLWQVSPGPPRPLVVVGATPLLETDGEAAGFLSSVHAVGVPNVTPLLRGSSPRVGYAEIPPGYGSNDVVYAETSLPAHKRAVIPKNSAFSDLNFALYLGHKVKPSELLEKTGPLDGSSAVARVPFGSSALVLVGTSSAPLGGGLSAALPWIVLIFGAALAIVAALIAEYLVRRRELAESLASENASLYLEQRANSETLQRSLLPEEIPDLAGVDIAVRYVPGVGGTEVGGDWYDVINTGDGCAFFVVGDVSGRGLDAASTMAYLRHSIRAYAVQGGGPAVVLAKLNDLVGRSGGGHFATVFCGHIDIDRHILTVACAGHFAPLVIDGDRARYVDICVGSPIGVVPPVTPIETTIKVGAGASVVAFTDGLIERRGENLDIGLERLAEAVSGRAEVMDTLLGHLLVDLTPNGSDDDIAILGVRWRG